MKITLESTSKVVELVTPTLGATASARIWEGHTESGIAVHCYITRIAVPAGEDVSQFERELQEMRAPTPDVEAIPARMIL